MNVNNDHSKVWSIISQKLFGKNYFDRDKILTEEEKCVVDFIRNYSYEAKVQEPIPDYIVFADNKNFRSKLPTDACNLYVDYTLFRQKVKQYESLGYDEMYFSFVEVDNNLINLLTNADNKDELEKLKGDLYIIVRFVQSTSNTIKNYFLFNVRYAENDVRLQSDILINNFPTSTTGLKFKNISNNAYLPLRINYKLAKVSKYMDALNDFSSDFNTDIIKVGFTYCLGEKPFATGNKEAFYLVSLPIDHRGNLSFFPYYDQGSLEP
ncbi:hypothetical protein [uncultured Chryseobacterium sp.]|uniref:hypothetical protein n=1 Tax=uncultured Chryseobacterium sp. TaxID=259322 RepID=UPI0027DE94F8|nr:hypothetical protein [uncultured Chryseobacterium sp.]